MKDALAADEAGVSVVGSRDARRGGVEMAAAIIRASSGGVVRYFRTGRRDRHRRTEATLAAGSQPIGVLGTGINRAYLAANRTLHDRVAAVRALVSQFPWIARRAGPRFRIRDAIWRTCRRHRWS